MSDNPFQSPISGDFPNRFGEDPLSRQTRTLTYIHPLTAGKVGGVLSALLMGIFLAIYGLGVISVGLGLGSAEMVVFGLFMMIGGPILYAVIGFIVGALGALVYNWVVRMGFALRFDVE